MSRRRTRRSSWSGSSRTNSAPIRRRAPTRSLRGCGRNWRRSRAPSHFRSTCRRFSAWAIPAASNSCWRRLQGQSPTDVAAVLRGLTRRGESAGPSSPRCSAPMPPTRRRSISTSIATRRRCSASRSATSSARCNRRWAVSTSTTSTFSAAPGRSTSRPTRRFASASTTSNASMCAMPEAEWCRSARWRKRSSCRGRRPWCATTATAPPW